MNLFSKKKKFERKVSLKQETRDGILSYCKMSHPDEGILILRGKSKHGNVLIDGLSYHHSLKQVQILQDFLTTPYL